MKRAKDVKNRFTKHMQMENIHMKRRRMCKLKSQGDTTAPTRKALFKEPDHARGWRKSKGTQSLPAGTGKSSTPLESGLSVSQKVALTAPRDPPIPLLGI